MGGSVTRQGLGSALPTLVLLLGLFWWRHLAVPLPVELPAAEAMPVGELLDGFARRHRVWGEALALLAVALNAALITRLTIRYMIAGVRTLLPMIFYAAVACGIFLPSPPLGACAASTLLTLSTVLFAASFRREYSFDTIFRASLCLGLLPFVYAPAMPLLALLPAAMLLYRRSAREWLVAMCGVSVAAGGVLLGVWFGGGNAARVLQCLGRALCLSPGNFALKPDPGEVVTIAAMGIFTVIVLLAVVSFAGAVRGMRAKPYKISLFLIVQGILCLLTLCAPGNGAMFCLLFAVPCSAVIPNLFIRYDGTAASLLYILFILSLLLRNILLFVR